MSDSDQNDVPQGSAEAEEAVGSIFDQPAGTDWALAWIVHMAHAHSIIQSVTLTVGGSMISGDVIGGRQFFEALSEQIDQGAFEGDEDGAVRRVLRDSWNTLGGGVYPPSSGETVHPMSYIHLRNARMFVPGQKPLPSKGMLWRGKLADVSGFSLGSLGFS